MWENETQTNKAGRTITKALLNNNFMCLLTPLHLRTTMNPSTGKQHVQLFYNNQPNARHIKHRNLIQYPIQPTQWKWPSLHDFSYRLTGTQTGQTTHLNPKREEVEQQ